MAPYQHIHPRLVLRKEKAELEREGGFDPGQCPKTVIDWRHSSTGTKTAAVNFKLKLLLATFLIDSPFRCFSIEDLTAILHALFLTAFIIKPYNERSVCA
jgi:hypothetical protein